MWNECKRRYWIINTEYAFSFELFPEINHAQQDKALKDIVQDKEKTSP